MPYDLGEACVVVLTPGVTSSNPVETATTSFVIEHVIDYLGGLLMMEIVELHDLSEKRKWMKRFAKAYKHGEVKDRPEVYGDRVRFFLAKEGSSDLGFI